TTYRGMSSDRDSGSGAKRYLKAASLRMKIWMESCMLSRAHSVITLTEQGRLELGTYGRTKDVVVLPNGVDVERFDAARVAQKDIDVIFSGRIERRKGSRAMVEVCRR